MLILVVRPVQTPRRRVGRRTIADRWPDLDEGQRRAEELYLGRERRRWARLFAQWVARQGGAAT
jgi:hypothetical protein